MKVRVIFFKTGYPILESFCIASLEGLVQNCGLNAICPRSLIFVTSKCEWGSTELLSIETIITLLRVVLRFRKSIWKALSCKMIAETDLIG